MPKFVLHFALIFFLLSHIYHNPFVLSHHESILTLHPQIKQSLHDNIQNSNTPCVNSLVQETGNVIHLIDHDEKLCPLQSHPPPNQPSGGWIFSVSESRQSYPICDPDTGKQMVLNESIIETPYLAVTGFGWDPISKVFKLARLFDDMNYKIYRGTYLEVFDFGRSKWGATKFKFMYFGEDHKDQVDVWAAFIKRFSNRPNVYLNGYLHWMSYPYHESIMLVSFNLHTEKLERFPMPVGLDLDPVESRPKFRFCTHGIPCDTRQFQHYLLVLGECLSLVHFFDDEHVEIWVMEQYGVQSSWKKKYILRDIVNNNGDIVKGPYKPIKLMENGEILLLCSDQKLGYYHPVMQVFRPTDSAVVDYILPVSEQWLLSGRNIYLAEG